MPSMSGSDKLFQVSVGGECRVEVFEVVGNVAIDRLGQGLLLAIPCHPDTYDPLIEA